MFLDDTSIPTQAGDILKSMKDALSAMPVIGVVVVLVPFPKLCGAFPYDITDETAQAVIDEAHGRAMVADRPIVLIYGYRLSDRAPSLANMRKAALVIDVRKCRYHWDK